MTCPGWAPKHSAASAHSLQLLGQLFAVECGICVGEVGGGPGGESEHPAGARRPCGEDPIRAITGAHPVPSRLRPAGPQVGGGTDLRQPEPELLVVVLECPQPLDGANRRCTVTGEYIQLGSTTGAVATRSP